MAQREQALLNTRYFHVVFTLPEALNPLAMGRPRLVYSTLFTAAWGTLKGFAGNPKFLGGQTGTTAVLHTWGQTLNLHPHLHCIVPAGGITKSGKWKATKSKGKYLFDVKAMSKVFRARYVSALSKEITLTKALRQQLFAKGWVVYAKQPFYGPKQVIAYLGRYTHKIAISNHRILALDGGRVSFSYKDYRQGGKQKTMRLSQGEFIRRFTLHILPKGFTRIRHYGILSSIRWQQTKIAVDSQLGALVLDQKTPPSQHRICPACKTGVLETIFCFDQRGPPQHWLEKLQQQQ
jgi:hypothetical protein